MIKINTTLMINSFVFIEDSFYNIYISDLSNSISHSILYFNSDFELFIGLDLNDLIFFMLLSIYHSIFQQFNLSEI